jgi:hypothetical protein
MADYKIDVPRIRDRDLFTFFREVSTAIGSTQLKYLRNGRSREYWR